MAFVQDWSCQKVMSTAMRQRRVRCDARTTLSRTEWRPSLINRQGTCTVPALCVTRHQRHQRRGVAPFTH